MIKDVRIIRANNHARYVSISKKDLDREGIVVGDEVEITVKKV